MVLALGLGESGLAFRITATTPKLTSGVCSTLCDPRDHRLVTSRTRRRRCEDGMCHRSRTGIPGLAEKRWKFPAVDQLDVAPFSERDCILGKTARGHDIAAGGLSIRARAARLESTPCSTIQAGSTTPSSTMSRTPFPSISCRRSNNCRSGDSCAAPCGSARVGKRHHEKWYGRLPTANRDSHWIDVGAFFFNGRWRCVSDAIY
jgi:hypothetical protein